MEVESGSGNLEVEVEVEGNLEDLRTNSGKWKTLGAYMLWRTYCSVLPLSYGRYVSVEISGRRISGTVRIRL